MDDASSQRTRDAIAWLQTQRTAMETLLCDLVEISSFTSDKPGVDRAGDRLAASLSLRAERIASDRYGDHRVFHGPRPASDGGVLLIGHVDTVFPREKFAGYRASGDTGYGPGVLDMKGGLVIAAFALRALGEAGLLADTPVSLVVATDEEVGSPDSTPHIRRVAVGARAALGFESGRPNDEIITQRKGTGSLTVLARGRAAHAGNAHREGANAVWALARFIDRAQALSDYGRGVTINVGKIAGGMGKNTVPDHAYAEVDLRFSTLEDEAALRQGLITAGADATLPGTSLDFEWGPGRPPLERTAASARLRDAYAQCQREAGLGDGELPLQGGGSDAATTAAMGIPSIDGLGVRGTGYHTTDERADLRSLVPKAEALVRYLCGGGAGG